MFEILGYIFAALILAIVLFFVYHAIKGAVIGASLTKWQLQTAGWAKVRAVKNWPIELVKLYAENWRECMFYDGFTVNRGHKGGDSWSWK